jgi:hypothetical protein
MKDGRSSAIVAQANGGWRWADLLEGLVRSKLKGVSISFPRPICGGIPRIICGMSTLEESGKSSKQSEVSEIARYRRTIPVLSTDKMPYTPVAHLQHSVLFRRKL